MVPVANDSPIVLQALTVNDFHGRIGLGGGAGGAAVLAGAVRDARAANPNTIFEATGDLIGATPFTSFIQNDTPTIDALNAAGLEVSAAGNHDFAQGWADLRDRVIPRADGEYISANVFLTDTGEPAMAPGGVTELEGVRVGVVGAVTEDLDSLVRPQDIAGLEVRSIVDTVNQAADDLRDGDPANGEADIVILRVHEGAASIEAGSITPGSPLGEIVYGVTGQIDAIISAHTHLAYAHRIDGRLVVSAGQYGERYGLMTFQVDRATKEALATDYENRPLVDADGSPLYEPVTAVEDIVSDAQRVADILGAEQVGTITADLNRARQSTGAENRGGESTIGNFIAEVHQWATSTDIGDDQSGRYPH